MTEVIRINPFNVSGFKARLTPRQADLAWKAVPPEKTAEWWIKLSALQNLTWQYIDSMLDTARAMRRPESKEVSRNLAKIRRAYDLCREHFIRIPDETQRVETHNAENFEEFYEGDFKMLGLGIGRCLKERGVKGDEYFFQLSLYQALAVYRAVQKYAHYIDGELQTHLPVGFPLPSYALVIGPFLNVYEQLNHLAKQRLVSNEVIDESARVLVMRLHDCGIYKSVPEDEVEGLKLDSDESAKQNRQLTPTAK